MSRLPIANTIIITVGTVAALNWNAKFTDSLNKKIKKSAKKKQIKALKSNNKHTDWRENQIEIYLLNITLGQQQQTSSNVKRFFYQWYWIPQYLVQLALLSPNLPHDFSHVLCKSSVDTFLRNSIWNFEKCFLGRQIFHLLLQFQDFIPTQRTNVDT
jgi:hypothetical protein